MADNLNTFDFYEIPEDPNHAKKGLDLYRSLEYQIPVKGKNEFGEANFVTIFPKSTADFLYEKLIAKYNEFNNPLEIPRPVRARDGKNPNEVLLSKTKLGQASLEFS